MPPRLFLDACALAKAYLEEEGSGAIQAIVESDDFRGRLLVSEHIEGEMLSLLNRAFRRERLTYAGLQDARRKFYTHFPAILAVIPSMEPIEELARKLLLRHPERRFTHPDARHLAAAMFVAEKLPDPNLTFVTSDRGLRFVAQRRRVPLFDPEHDPLVTLSE